MLSEGLCRVVYRDVLGALLVFMCKAQQLAASTNLVLRVCWKGLPVYKKVKPQFLAVKWRSSQEQNAGCLGSTFLLFWVLDTAPAAQTRLYSMKCWCT